MRKNSQTVGGEKSGTQDERELGKCCGINKQNSKEDKDTRKLLLHETMYEIYTFSPQVQT